MELEKLGSGEVRYGVVDRKRTREDLKGGRGEGWRVAARLEYVGMGCPQPQAKRERRKQQFWKKESAETGRLSFFSARGLLHEYHGWTARLGTPGHTVF